MQISEYPPRLLLSTHARSRTSHSFSRYVPHANRALRNLNMYLNVRQPPLRSKLPFALLFAKLFPRTPPSPTPSSRAASPTAEGKRRSPSPDARPAKRSSSVPIAPIPPANNPRGELIFSSRVDRTFRDAYERYRNAFERKREERERAAFEKTWLGWFQVRVLRLRAPAAASAIAGTAGSGTATPVGRTGSLSGSVRGRASPAGTPSSSRRSSPVPRKARRSSPVGASSLSTASPVSAERSDPIPE